MPNSSVPVLETPRLRLRAHRLEDFPACCALWADPIVTRFIGGKPSAKQQVWARLTSYVGHWSLLGFGYWVVEEKASGRYVGELGFADFKREIEPALELPELGWALSPAVHGLGYASEALRTALDWGDAHFPTGTTCLIDPANAPSLRVAEKCGFREVTRTTYLGAPTIVFARKKKAGSSPASQRSP